MRIINGVIFMTSSCWPLQRQNYRSWWIAYIESAVNTAE